MAKLGDAPTFDRDLLMRSKDVGRSQLPSELVRERKRKALGDDADVMAPDAIEASLPSSTAEAIPDGSHKAEKRRRLRLLQRQRKKAAKLEAAASSSSEEDASSESEEEAPPPPPPKPTPKPAPPKPAKPAAAAPPPAARSKPADAPALPTVPRPRSAPQPTVFVPVTRSAEVQAQRAKLPVCAEEQVIMETIAANDFVIISGETGSGKTTQVPQFLYEAGFGSASGARPGRIGITEPRRVAAVSMAARVGHELGAPDKVSYQIRFDGTVSDATVIKFMTDGVLLKELSTDILLSGYSAIIVDEAHERGLNTDILIGLLSRAVPLRRKLMQEQIDAGVTPSIRVRLILVNVLVECSVTLAS